jgi:hypothetical protein
MSGTAIREDMALLQFTSALKYAAEKNNVGVATMIQLNVDEKGLEVFRPPLGVLRLSRP